MTSSTTKRISHLLIAAMVLGLAGGTHAVQIQNLVRIKGSEASKLQGMGLVFGLDGTGDGGDFLPAMRPLASMIQNLIDPNTTPVELQDASNVAVVYLTADIPAFGVREGDQVDVKVSTYGPCKSLVGGRLAIVPLVGPLPNSPVFAYAEGDIIVEDPETPTVGIVRAGGQMVRDIRAQFIDSYGRLTLVLNESVASWLVANNIASLINGVISPDGPAVAKAVDPRNVVVSVPIYERENPSAFISDILKTYIDPTMLGTGARVVINEKTGTIVMGAQVEISPVVISHGAMTINIVVPEIEPTPERPVERELQVIGMDPQRRGGAKLSDLEEAFNRLKVSAKDRIEILRAMQRQGALHAEVISQ